MVVKEGYRGEARWNAEFDELEFSVLFLYPEFFQSDFIQAVGASHSMGAHVSAMFPPQEAFAPWDRRRQYTSDVLDIYYEIEAPRSVESYKLS